MAPTGPWGVALLGHMALLDMYVYVTLLEKMCHLGWALKSQKLKQGCGNLSHLSSTMSACVLPCFSFNAMMIMD